MSHDLVELEIEPAQHGSARRLDQLVLDSLRRARPSLAHLSRARLKEAFQAGAVRMDGRKARPSDPAPAHAFKLEIDFPLEEPAARPDPRGCLIPVVHEDAGLLVLGKPAGVASVPHSAEETDTAVSAALARFPGLAAIGKGGLEPGLLHRLDTGTSGLLAFAKTESEFARLRELWSSGGVRKIYRALARPGAETLPRAPMDYRIALAHDAKSARRMLVFEPRKRQAIRGNPLPTLTRIVSVSEIRGAPDSGGLLDLEIEITTGVMHQIRCTLAHLGFPILGDPIYGGHPSERLWLHAWKLEIPRADGGTLCLEAPIPEGWPG